MNIEEALTEWEILMRRAAELEKKILREVGSDDFRIPGARVRHSAGRGSYDYLALAHKLEPDDYTIQKYTKPVTDWKAVCEETGMEKGLKDKFFTPGNPSVKIELVG